MLEFRADSTSQVFYKKAYPSKQWGVRRPSGNSHSTDEAAGIHYARRKVGGCLLTLRLAR